MVVLSLEYYVVTFDIYDGTTFRELSSSEFVIIVVVARGGGVLCHNGSAAANGPTQTH
jgi:hypothetical protein